MQKRRSQLPQAHAGFIAESAVLAGLLCACIPSAAADRPPLALAGEYETATVDLSHYWISEKYDGVRAYWNGRELLTRAGHVIHAPEWFTHQWPATSLDGELWAGRGQFETTTATVRDSIPDHDAWRHIRFMVFDLPAHAGTFDERLTALQSLLSSLAVAWVRPVPQFRIRDPEELEQRLQSVTAAGGEGLMLRRDDSPYRAERSEDLLKLKPYQDAEAQVIGYSPGQGKYSGMLGALWVRTTEGLEFRIGTGLTDEQRRHPPELGSWVTYSYHGATARGVPRFARFLRVRGQ